MLYITLFTSILFAQEEVKIKDGRTIIINANGTWEYKQSISKDSRDQGVYKTVKIGTQIWMTENLNVDRFRNGDLIPEVKTKEEWVAAGKRGNPAWCYYDNNPENGKKFGKLYNWYAVNDKRGLAPKGWHIPTYPEFQILGAAVNNNSNALKAIGQGEKEGAGTNTSGFSALLISFRNNLGNFSRLGFNTFFWSFNEFPKEFQAQPAGAYSMDLWYNDGDFKIGHDDKESGFSIRCVKD